MPSRWPSPRACSPPQPPPPSKGSSPPPRNRQAWLCRGALKAGRVQSEAPGKGRGQQSPGQLIQAKPLHPERSLETVGGAGWGSVHACTLYPVSRPHNAQGASGAGSQGPLMPVPSGRPCQVLEGQLKKPDSVLGHSQALFLSQGGKRDSPPVNGGPWRGGGGNRALTVPRGLPTRLPAPGSDRPLVAWPCTSLRQGRASPRADKEVVGPGQPGPHSHTGVLDETPEQSPKGTQAVSLRREPGIPCTPHTGMSLAGRDGPPSRPALQHPSRVAPDLTRNSRGACKPQSWPANEAPGTVELSGAVKWVLPSSFEGTNLRRKTPSQECSLSGFNNSKKQTKGSSLPAHHQRI